MIINRYINTVTRPVCDVHYVGMLHVSFEQVSKLQYKRHVRMEILDLVVVLTLLKAEWRCALTVPGEQSVTIALARLMQTLCAHSWAIDSMGLKYDQYLNMHKAVVLYSSMN